VKYKVFKIYFYSFRLAFSHKEEVKTLRVTNVLQKNFKHLKNTHAENMSMPCGLWKTYLELQYIQRDFIVINLNCYICTTVLLIR